MDNKTLALYLGCRMRVNKYGKDFYGALEGLTNNELWIRIDGDRIATPERYFAKCTLLLRPLSSMTEEEMSEAGCEDNGNFSGWMAQGCGGMAIKTAAYNIQYLLSKGFDLFGLIEKGDAIDSTLPNQ